MLYQFSIKKKDKNKELVLTRPSLGSVWVQLEQCVPRAQLESVSVLRASLMAQNLP